MFLDFSVIAAAVAFIVTSGLRTSAPIILASVGGCFSSQVKVFNIGLEGMMLAGAFAGFAASDLTGSAFVGLAVGAIAGLVVSLLIALACVTFHADEIIVGFSVNLGVLGLTAILLSAIYGSQGSYMSATAGMVPNFDVSALNGVPIIGSLVNSADWVILVTPFIVALGSWITYRTVLGLRMRSVGDNDHAVEAAGINVASIRYIALAIGGVTCGFAGAYLPLSGLSLFSVGMTAGVGFVAVAAVIFADGRPVAAALVALLFGLSSASSLQLERLGVPTELVQSLPYILTIAALAIKHSRVAQVANDH